MSILKCRRDEWVVVVSVYFLFETLFLSQSGKIFFNMLLLVFNLTVYTCLLYPSDLVCNELLSCLKIVIDISELFLLLKAALKSSTRFQFKTWNKNNSKNCTYLNYQLIVKSYTLHLSLSLPI